VQGWFLAHFPYFFSVDDNPKYLSNYLITVKWEIQRGHGEVKTYHALLDRFEMYDVCWSCTKNTGRFRSLRRYFGIQVGSCVVFRRYIDTCLSELTGSTDTCKTSLDLRQMFLLCELLIFHKLSSTFVLTPLRMIVGVSRHKICHGGSRMDI
jgi:hypothetical protein